MYSLVELYLLSSLLPSYQDTGHAQHKRNALTRQADILPVHSKQTMTRSTTAIFQGLNLQEMITHIL
jgi:hypothetical protein